MTTDRELKRVVALLTDESHRLAAAAGLSNEEARQFLMRAAKEDAEWERSDKVAKALRNAPLDDEPVTPSERAELEDARDELRNIVRGED